MSRNGGNEDGSTNCGKEDDQEYVVPTSPPFFPSLLGNDLFSINGKQGVYPLDGLKRNQLMQTVTAAKRMALLWSISNNSGGKICEHHMAIALKQIDTVNNCMRNINIDSVIEGNEHLIYDELLQQHRQQQEQQQKKPRCD